MIHLDAHLDTLTVGFAPTSLSAINSAAKLQTRKDRKYILSRETLEELLAALPADVEVLEIDGRRWSQYRSVYFDTPELDCYRLAATRRPQRFKVRTRTYVDSGLSMAEVKTKSCRSKTVKHRRVLDAPDGQARAVVDFAREVEQSCTFADRLEPVMVSEYQRATLALLTEGVRVTIDADLVCTDLISTDLRGARSGLTNGFIVETKSGGSPSTVDRILWGLGHRPVKVSKFATGLASLRPDLPANRWNRVLRRHFTCVDAPQLASPLPSVDPQATVHTTHTVGATQ